MDLSGKTKITLTLAVVLVSILVSAVWSAGMTSQVVKANSARIAEMCELQKTMPTDYVPRAEYTAQMDALLREIQGLRRDIKDALTKE